MYYTASICQLWGWEFQQINELIFILNQLTQYCKCV